MSGLGNCHNYCRYSRWCNAKGEIGIKEFDCPNYWHWDDVYMEAERDREYENEDNLCGDYEDDFTEEDLI